MIYSVLSDRLGNILFEIAAGISLARRLNVPFKAFVGQEDYRYVEYVLQYKKSILRKIDFAESMDIFSQRNILIKILSGNYLL